MNAWAVPPALAGSILGVVGVLLILAQGAWDLYVRWAHERLRRQAEPSPDANVVADQDFDDLNQRLLDDYERRMRRYRWWQAVMFVLGAGLLLCSYAVQIAVNADLLGP